MYQILDTATFNRKLSESFYDERLNRETRQELIVDAIYQAQQHGNLDRLTKIVQSCVNVRSLPTRTIQGYIQAHVKCSWVKSDNSKGFRWSDKKDKAVTIPSVSYYDWKGNSNKAAQEYDPVKAMRAVITNTEKALREGRVKDADKANELLKKLKGAA